MLVTKNDMKSHIKRLIKGIKKWRGKRVTDIPQPRKKLDGKEYHNPSKAFMKNVLCHTNSNLF